jgi:hypothetical protein
MHIVKKLCTAFALTLLPAAASMMQAGTLSKAEERFGVSGVSFAYASNGEYFGEYREGESLLGAWARARLSWIPAPGFDFSIGAHLGRQFGDEKAFRELVPLFRARFRTEALKLIIGELEGEGRHRLPPALVRSEVRYRSSYEEGIQVLVNREWIEQDLWLHYDALNTAEHREHLRLGNRTVLRRGSTYAVVAGCADHFGGQLHAPEDDPVRENLAGAVGAGMTLPLEGVVERIGAEVLLLGSLTTADRSRHAYATGRGVSAGIEMVFFGLAASLHHYRGRDFVAWNGEPLFRTDEPYWYLTLDRRMTLHQHAFLEFQLQLDLLDADSYTTTQAFGHRFCILMGGRI